MATTAIEPLYRTEEPNQTIDLGSAQIALTVSGKQLNIQADFFLRFLPSPRLEIRIRPNGIPGLHQLADIGSILTLNDPGTAIGCFASSSGTSGITLIPQEPIIIPSQRDTRPAKYVIFHLVNFPAFFAASATIGIQGTRHHRLDRIVLEANGWKTTLDLIAGARDNIKRLKETGGFAITHAGRVERVDGTTFSISEAQDAISFLHVFFSNQTNKV